VILDNSLSMGFREEKGAVTTSPGKRRNRLVEALKGEVLVLSATTSKERTGEQGESTRPLAEVCGGLEEIRGSIFPILRPGGSGTCDELAYRRLKETTGDKEILVISDMARGDWERFDLSKLDTVAGEAAVTFLKIGGANRDPILPSKR